jgi:leader peptidase (prepilin peptidase)/N-methyltransferase
VSVTAALGLVGGVLGLVAGSFLNVVAARVPEGRSVVRPGSACPGCGAPIRPRDNIPVISWLVLRGRCRDCGSAISVRYPLVEIGTAALFAATAFVIGARAVLPAYWWAAAVAFVLAIIDLDTQRIPNRILYPGTVVGAVLLAAGALVDGEPAALLRALGGGAGYFTLLLVVAIAARGGFGFGDVKLGFLLGMFLAYLSWGTLAVGVFGAFLAGGLAAVGLLLVRRVGRRDAIPFGPAMVVGAFAAAAWGPQIAAWYLG